MVKREPAFGDEIGPISRTTGPKSISDAGPSGPREGLINLDTGFEFADFTWRPGQASKLLSAS
jgi:hypothetical protein